MSIVDLLKTRSRDSTIHRWMRRRQGESAILNWERDGRPIPPPPAYKQKRIQEVGKKFGARILIETGTNWGDTIASSLNNFDRIYSVELSTILYRHAVERFGQNRKVVLRHGDSAVELSNILSELRQPAVFWLDAHYSGEGTARANKTTPIIAELLGIFTHQIPNHAVLIDDARLFNGNDDYPTVDDCKMIAARLRPDHLFCVAEDLIEILPASKP